MARFNAAWLLAALATGPLVSGWLALIAPVSNPDPVPDVGEADPSPIPVVTPDEPVSPFPDRATRKGARGAFAELYSPLLGARRAPLIVMFHGMCMDPAPCRLAAVVP